MNSSKALAHCRHTEGSAATSYCFYITEKSPRRQPPSDPRPQQSRHAPAHLAGRSLPRASPGDLRRPQRTAVRVAGTGPRPAGRAASPGARAPPRPLRAPHPTRGRRWLHRRGQEAPGRSPPQAGRPSAAGVTRATGPRKAGSSPATPRASGLPLPACLGRALTTFPRRRLGDPREMPSASSRPSVCPREVRGNARPRA